MIDVFEERQPSSGMEHAYIHRIYRHIMHVKAELPQCLFQWLDWWPRDVKRWRMAVVASVGGDPKPHGVIQAPILPPLTGTGSTLQLIDMASLLILKIQRDNENRLEQITLRALLFTVVS